MSALWTGLARGITIGVTAYIFIDAKKRGKNRWVWSILALLFGFLVLGIYLLSTGRKVWGIIWLCVGVLELLLLIAPFLLAIFGM